MRTTPNNITSLSENERFVFGSNTGGIHAGGAARIAHSNFGATWGQGEGFSGQSYAIPTLDNGFQQLPIERIKMSVDYFIKYAKQFEGVPIVFLVTEIGCGIAGFKVEEIAPLFEGAKGITNIHLPERFWQIIGR